MAHARPSFQVATEVAGPAVEGGWNSSRATTAHEPQSDLDGLPIQPQPA